MKFIADQCVFFGLTMFTLFLDKGVDETIEDFAEAIEYIMNIVEGNAFGTYLTEHTFRPSLSTRPTTKVVHGI